MQQEFYERVRVTIDDDIAQVTLIRAERHNGMDFPMLKAMLAAQKMLRRRRDVRCAIVHGDGPSFCAGLDIKSVMSNKRSEEHTSELQSLMRISYAVFCLKKKKQQKYNNHSTLNTITAYTLRKIYKSIIT